MQHRKAISLTSKDDAFITQQIDDGEYGNASEVVRAGLRLLDQELIKLEALRRTIAEGHSDLKAGRTKAYAQGQLAERLNSRLGKADGKTR
jgi:antitoxin ParD1/3/4